MFKLKRMLSLAVSLTLAAALVLPAHAADPLSESFASFLIDADSADFPQLNLHVELYRRDNAGAFQADDSVRYACQVNRVAGEASFLIQPQTDGVWVEVDYLTDLNGDGIYEMLDGGQGAPVCDSMTPGGQLTPWSGANHILTRGQTYILTAQTLREGAAAALQARNAAGNGQALPFAGGTLPDRDTVLYFITLHYLSPLDQQEYALSYYLRIFDSVIMPSDVARSAWYYDAVEFVLDQGYLSGTDPDAFSPAGTVTRAQLAQILWRLGGSKIAADPGFPDVNRGDWFYDAVSWCSQAGLMSGADSGFLPNSPLTREQLALVLLQYTQSAGLEPSGAAALSRFSDGGSSADWARGGLEWATANGLLSGYIDGSLRPASGLSRAELSAVLRTFCQTILDL